MAKKRTAFPGSPLSPKSVSWYSWNSVLGRIHAASTASGLCLILIGRIDETQVLRSLQTRYGCRPLRKKHPFQTFMQELEEYSLGRRSSFSIPIDMDQGTAFNQAVWKTLTRIPFGETRSYQWVASGTGRPLASRAVGGACGRNPLPIVIPCHRVIASSGKLGGYTGGLSIKKHLLRIEKSCKTFQLAMC